MNKKILSKQSLSSLLKKWRAQQRTIVFTNGCFDLLHIGHLRYLKKAKQFGDILIIGLNSDASVRKLKGKSRPLTPLTERAEMLSGLEVVDYVIPFSQKTPEQLIRLIRPNIHAKGGDYEANTLPEAILVKALGGTVKILPLTQGKSTTTLLEKIRRLKQV